MLKLNAPDLIYLYDEGVKGLDFKKIKRFINENFGRVPVVLRKLKKGVVSTRGLLFDFIGTSKAFGRFSATEINSCHIIFTAKLFATLDEFGKPHIRASLYGFPSVISASGIVEGPAKPKEYYRYKQRYAGLGAWPLKEPEVKKKISGRFIDYGDKRINEAIKGYVSQALFYFMTGEPFCPRKGCRLYNAHWQKELIYSQVTQARFCAFHKNILRHLP